MENNSGSSDKCQGLTKTGRPCSKRASSGGFCSSHAIVGLVDVAKNGNRAETLEALRDKLAAELQNEAEIGYCDKCKRSSSSVAPLAKQFRDVLAELAELSPTVRKDPVRDELERRREARKSEAS